MLSLVVTLVLLVPEVPPQCAAPPQREMGPLTQFAQTSGSLSVGLDSVATWCFDSSGAWTGGTKKAYPAAAPTGDCQRAIAACEGSKAAISESARQLMYDTLAEIDRPFLGVKYKPKRSGLAERPSEAVECRSKERSVLFANAQARMDLGRLANVTQNEYANYRTWLFSEGLKCAQAVARGEKDLTRRGIAVDAVVQGGGTQKVPEQSGSEAGSASANGDGKTTVVVAGVNTAGGTNAGGTNAAGGASGGSATAGAGGANTAGGAAGGSATAGTGGANTAGGASGGSATAGAGGANALGGASGGSATNGAGGANTAGGASGGSTTAGAGGANTAGGASGGSATAGAGGANAVGGSTAGGAGGANSVGGANAAGKMGGVGGANVGANANAGANPNAAGPNGTTTITGGTMLASAGQTGPRTNPAFIGGPTAEREKALGSSMLEKWRYFLGEQQKLEGDIDWTGGFLASRELRDCRCVRPIPGEVVRRLEKNEKDPAVAADDDKNTRCELCLLDAYPRWKSRSTKQCALAMELTEYEIGVLQRSDDGNGLPQRCIDAAKDKLAGKTGRSGKVTFGDGTTQPATGGGSFIIMKNDPAPQPAPEPPKPTVAAAPPMPPREDGRIYVRVFTSTSCTAEVLPGPVVARNGDLLPVPTSAKEISVRGDCGGIAELYFGKEDRPRVSESFARNQPLRLQFRQ